MSCSRRSGDPTPAGTQDPETPPWTQLWWVGPAIAPPGHSQLGRQVASGAEPLDFWECILRRRRYLIFKKRPGLGGTSVTRCVLPLLSTQGEPLCHGGR